MGCIVDGTKGRRQASDTTSLTSAGNANFTGDTKGSSPTKIPLIIRRVLDGVINH